MISQKLTIAIPTYNRSSSLRRLLETCSSIGSLAEVLVCDDGSDDSTMQVIAEFNHRLPIRLERNDSNLGYAKNFIKLFEKCVSEWMLVVADDDLVIADGFNQLEEIFFENAAFICPGYLREGVVVRVPGGSGKIELDKVFSFSAHASGLFYNIKKCQRYLDALSERLEKGCQFSLVYPQIVILTHILIEDSEEALGKYIDAALVEEGDRLPTGIKQKDGQGYDAFCSRIAQSTDFFSLVDGLNSSMAERDSLYLALEKSMLHVLIRNANPGFSKDIVSRYLVENSRGFRLHFCKQIVRSILRQIKEVLAK